MKKEELNDRILDEIIKYAVAKEVEEEQWPTEEELASKYEFSEQFETNMKKLFARQKRREKVEQIIKSTLKVAAVIIIFVATSLAVVMNVDALRVNVLNYLSEIGDKSTTISIGGGNNTLPTLQGEAVPGYIPVGYEKIVFNSLEDYYLAIYQNNEGKEISIEMLPEGATVGIDSEDAYSEQLTLHGNRADYFEKNNMNSLVFIFEGKFFFLRSSLPKEEVLKMAESVTYMK